MHDEYWHEHVDADQYPGFEYTALIYLNDQVPLSMFRASYNLGTQTLAQVLWAGGVQSSSWRWQWSQGEEGDYTGWQFSFVDPPEAEGDQERVLTRSPKCWKLVFFTSGPENVHHVHKVEHGKRYALTIAFTCNKTKVLLPSEVLGGLRDADCRP